jgi:hypothetical protein
VAARVEVRKSISWEGWVEIDDTFSSPESCAFLKIFAVLSLKVRTDALSFPLKGADSLLFGSSMLNQHVQERTNGRAYDEDIPDFCFVRWNDVWVLDLGPRISPIFP